MKFILREKEIKNLLEYLDFLARVQTGGQHKYIIDGVETVLNESKHSSNVWYFIRKNREGKYEIRTEIYKSSC